MTKSITAAVLIGCALIQGCASVTRHSPTAAEDDKLVADSGFAAPALASCRTDLKYLNQIGGWQVAWPRQWAAVVASSDRKAVADGITQWSAAPSAMREAIEQLKQGIGQEESAPRAVVLRVQQQLQDLDAVLRQDNSPYLLSAPDDDVASRWNRLIQDDIQPAVAAFAAFLQHEYLLAARTAPGIANTAQGAECFAGAVAHWTTLSLAPEKIEGIGNALLAQTRAELMATADATQSFNQVMQELRRFQAENTTTAAQLIRLSEDAIARAEQLAPSVFSGTPANAIAVKAMPQHMQDSFPAGQYIYGRGGADATYSINPSRPKERRLMAEAIAFHEAIPGHHLYFNYPGEGASAKHNAGIVEGWGIYAEYLADELGLYSTLRDRQGMMTKHLWAASRLVVEPGLHLHGWSREQAIVFMLDNTLLSRAEIEVEVDRYIAMPGQSLSYMLGANLILEERRRAQQRLGDAFDLVTFHQVVLGPGSRPLENIRADIRQWVTNSM